MWEKIANPGAALAEAALLGTFLSMVYDMFRIRRALFSLPAWFVFAEDTLYCLFSAFAFFLVLMDAADGSPRWWLLFGLAVGWTAEHFTVGLVAVTLAQWILFALRNAVWLFLRVTLLPLLRRIRQKNHGKNGIRLLQSGRNNGIINRKKKTAYREKG